MYKLQASQNPVPPPRSGEATFPFSAIGSIAQPCPMGVGRIALALTSRPQPGSAHSSPHRPVPPSPLCPSLSSCLFYLLCIFGGFLLLAQSLSSHFTLLLCSAPFSAFSLPSKPRDENMRTTGEV